MSEENVEKSVNTEAEIQNKEPEAPKKAEESSKEDIERLIQERVAASLKDIKSKLDGAYSARDAALKRIAEFEQKEKEAELARLKEEGKHKEAYELQLAQERARIEALEKRNIELTRDIEVKNALSAFTFKSESASNMAYNSIVSELVQNENGEWIHKTGTSIHDYVKQFSDQNPFLFEQKISTGPGVTTTKTTSPSSTPKSLFELSQEEVLKLAMEGKLPTR